MIELYLDTADLKKVARFNQCLPLNLEKSVERGIIAQDIGFTVL
jgi:hypothetical protein